MKITVSVISGNAKITTASSYRVSPTTVGRITSETCATIWTVLIERGVLNVPTTQQEWKEVEYFLKKNGTFQTVWEQSMESTLVLMGPLSLTTRGLIV